MKRGWTYAVAAALLGLLAGCEGRGHYSSVPDAFVYIQVNVPVYYPHLNGIGFSECFTKDDINVTQQNRDNWVRATGYGGVLVYAAPSANPDNLSGVESYKGTVDGRFVLFEMDKHSVISCRLDRENIARGKHELKIIATDACGNTSTYTHSFIW